MNDVNNEHDKFEFVGSAASTQASAFACIPILMLLRKVALAFGSNGLLQLLRPLTSGYCRTSANT